MISMIKERFIWVDYAKVLSICLVVSFHAPPRIEGYAGDVIQLLRMPAFFLIAGYLFKIEKFTSLWQFIKHRSIQLLVPYASFFTLFYILWLVVGRNMVGGEELEYHVLEPLYEFISGNPTIVIAPCWFICCLFSIQIIYYLLAKYIPRKYLLALVILFPYLNCLTNLYGLPWNLAMAFNYIPFYAFSNQYKELITRISWKQWPVIVSALIVVLLSTYYINSENEWIGCTLHTVNGLLILPAYILLCKTISIHKTAYRFVEFIGRNTIIILAIQNYIIGIIKIICTRFYGENIFDDNYLLHISIVLFVILISAIPILIINKYFPFIVGRGTYFNKQLTGK